MQELSLNHLFVSQKSIEPNTGRWPGLVCSDESRRAPLRRRLIVPRFNPPCGGFVIEVWSAPSSDALALVTEAALNWAGAV